MIWFDKQLDFHDYGLLSEYDIEVILSNFIEDAYIAHAEQLLVITGKGKVVRPTVDKLLKQNKYVAVYKRAGYSNGGEGAFEVKLIS